MGGRARRRSAAGAGRPGAGHRRGRRRTPAGAPRLRAAVALALGLALSACGERVKLDALAAGPRTKALHATAGDVLALEGGKSVRLAGVEAPAPDAPWGEAAKATLERLAAGRRVDLLYGGKADDGAGHALAQVRVVDGAWLEGALLEAGVARVRPRPGEAAMAPEMLEREAKARAAGRGLWRDPAYRVRLPDEFGWDDKGLQVVEGRVRRVGGHGATTYLDFADDYRGVVSAELPSKTLRDWRAAGRDPQALRGKLVRVRGEANGYHLSVEAPEAVEVLKDR